MSEVKKWYIGAFGGEAQARPCSPAGFEIIHASEGRYFVLSSDFDRVTAERDALRAPLAEACEMLKEIRQDGYHSHKRDSQIDSFLSATSTPEPDHE
jgi:hypothetical protein